MKIRIGVLFLMFCTGWTVLFAGEDNTARACRQNINKWDGRKVSLDVVYLNPLDTTGTLPNALVALAYTWDSKKQSFGGMIPVLFQQKEGERALKRYGVTGDFVNSVKTKSLRGILTRIIRPGTTNLIYLDCSDSGPYADDIKPSLIPILEKLPEDVENPSIQVRKVIIQTPRVPPPPNQRPLRVLSYPAQPPRNASVPLRALQVNP